jgi:hypothetical protein
MKGFPQCVKQIFCLAVIRGEEGAVAKHDSLTEENVTSHFVLLHST